MEFKNINNIEELTKLSSKIYSDEYIGELLSDAQDKIKEIKDSFNSMLNINYRGSLESVKENIALYLNDLDFIENAIVHGWERLSIDPRSETDIKQRIEQMEEEYK